MLARLNGDMRTQLCVAFINIAAVKDWGICPLPNGRWRFRYFRDLMHLHNLFTGLPAWLLDVKPGPERKKRAFRAVFDQARRTLSCLLCPVCVRTI